MRIPWSLIEWSTKYPYPLQVDQEDIPWQIVDQKEFFNFNLNKSTVKASNSFVTAKESKPLLYNITEPTSTICRADNYDGSKAIKRFETFHNSNKIIVDQQNKESDWPKKRQKVVTCNKDNTPPGTQWDENNYSCAYDAFFFL